MRRARLYKISSLSDDNIPFTTHYQFHDSRIKYHIKYLDTGEKWCGSARDLFNQDLDLLGYFKSAFHSVLVPITDNLWDLLDLIDIEEVNYINTNSFYNCKNIPCGLLMKYTNCIIFRTNSDIYFEDYCIFHNISNVLTLYDLFLKIVENYMTYLRESKPLYIELQNRYYKINYDKSLVSYLIKTKVLR